MSDATLFDESSDKEKPSVPMVREENALTSDGFISMVLAQPDGAEKIALLRELIAMRDAERKRIAQEQFDTHFAEMRNELQPVVKSTVNKGTNSMYASIETMQDVCDPVIFKHGFSYSWREEALEAERKRIIMDICGYGHTKSVSWDAPKFEGNRATNALQSAGIQSTYGQRYTYKGGFGIVTKGEDTDGQHIDIDDEMRNDLASIGGSKTMEALMNCYKSSYEKYKGEPEKLRLIIGEYNIRKQDLSKAVSK